MIKAVFFDLGHTLTKEVNVQEKVEALLKPYNLSWKRFYPFWKNFYYLRSIGKILNDKEMFSLLERVLERKNIPFQKIRDIIIFESHIILDENIKIIKEIKRILKPDGILCVGEVVNLKEEIPPFVQDIYDSSDLEPLKSSQIENYYTERNFKLIEQKDLSFTLEEYYTKSLFELKKSIKELAENEKAYYKKLINMISHEAKAYLKEGAKDFVGFYSLILKKK